MGRAPFQVLVLPFRLAGDGEIEFAALLRRDMSVWQGVAGGGEIGETPWEAASREAAEELSLRSLPALLVLDSRASIPAHLFADRSSWPEGTYVIPEYAFGADVTGLTCSISEEHTEIRWDCYDVIAELFRWDSNRVALWELNERLHQKRL